MNTTSVIRIMLLVPLFIACGITLAMGSLPTFAALALVTMLVAFAK